MELSPVYHSNVDQLIPLAPIKMKNTENYGKFQLHMESEI